MSENKLRSAYMELVRIVRTLYQTCRLVHADLSEYNILWHEGSLFVIGEQWLLSSPHLPPVPSCTIPIASIAAVLIVCVCVVVVVVVGGKGAACQHSKNGVHGLLMLL